MSARVAHSPSARGERANPGGAAAQHIAQRALLRRGRVLPRAHLTHFPPPPALLHGAPCGAHIPTETRAPQVSLHRAALHTHAPQPHDAAMSHACRKRTLDASVTSCTSYSSEVQSRVRGSGNGAAIGTICESAQPSKLEPGSLGAPCASTPATLLAIWQCRPPDDDAPRCGHDQRPSAESLST